jgi:hypothetical protein
MRSGNRTSEERIASGILCAMTLPTDPQSIAEMDRLMAEVEEAKARWLMAIDRLKDWIDAQDAPHAAPPKRRATDRQWAGRR